MKIKITLIGLILLSPLLCFHLLPSASRDYKEGDIIFQVSKSRQSSLIQYATGSIYSHCGVIVYKNGQPYVLEAISTVQLTPLQKWIDRGRFGKVKSVRIFEKKDVKIKYKKYLGYKYDLAFKFDNGKYYCSELVYLIYKDQFGIELCKPKKLKEYNLFGIEDKARKRGMSLEQLVVAPSDILNTKCKL